MKCETVHGQTFGPGDNMTLSDDTVPQSADIVIVVSKRACNGDVINKLTKVVAQTDKALAAKGIRNIRYR